MDDTDRNHGRHHQFFGSEESRVEVGVEEIADLRIFAYARRSMSCSGVPSKAMRIISWPNTTKSQRNTSRTSTSSASLFLEAVGDVKEKKVLDLACGDGLTRRHASASHVPAPLYV